MFRRVLFIAIVIVILTGSNLLGACTATQPAKTPSATPAAKTAEGPLRGGVIRTGALEEPANYEPYASTSHRILVHSSAIWNALVKCDPMKPEVASENMIPDLAEKWEISPDGKTYTFYLYQGVKFHDGHPFTAEDVKYSLDKFRDPKVSALATNVAAVDNIQIVNDYTVKVNLKYPYSELLIFLCAPYASIQGAHMKNVDSKSTDFLIGTGPFKFQSRVSGKSFTYVRNPDYFKKGLPYLDRYEIYFLNNVGMQDQFIGGRLDTCGTLRQFGAEDLNRIKRLKEQAPEAIRQVMNNGSTRGLLFNFKREGPWQDIKVRRAMTMALDYDGAMIATFGSLELGYVAPAGILPFEMKEALTQKELMSMLGLDKPMEQRISAAKQLMKDAGYPNGFSATCICRNSNLMFDPPLFGADIWKKTLNIDMKVEPLDAPKLFPMRDSGEFDLFFGDFNSSTGSSSIEFIGSFESQSLLNSGKWSNAEYDKLFYQIIEEIDATKKVAAARKAQQILFNELPYLPFHATIYGSTVRPDLRTGWPPAKGTVLQPTQTNLAALEVTWFANTPDAKRWTDTQK